MFKTTIFSLATGLVLLSTTSFAATDTDDMKTSLRQACQNDMQQFCNDITPGEGRMMACLKSHEDKLSTGCKQEWQSLKSRWHESMMNNKACMPDIQKFCTTPETSKDIKACLDDQ